MRTPKDLVYTESHEWLRVDGDKIYLGITDFAQDQLGDIVFVEIPEVDSLVEPMDAIAVVESVKAVSSIFSPVTGTVLEANEELETSPELLNEDPYENWIAIISIEDESELDDLITAEAYDAYCAQLDV
ncbi:MAG TPA: glycine cleavage system protein GcvH [Syntrophomonadaceae bacterium]|nr:glycine cleavage system protein GcvH [Syntrophomonadaceae bacterium]